MTDQVARTDPALVTAAVAGAGGGGALAAQTRKSGDDYITHPLAVATILADLGMTAATLAAALLHDTVEDAGYALDALREDFGDEIAQLVDGVTKLDKVRYGDTSAAETVRKMVVAMAGTSGCWSSSWPTGSTTCAPCAGCRRRSSSRRHARPWRSTRPWLTGWG
jgi:(p)ppGpp synthase/HD superfamily hydrolase